MGDMVNWAKSVIEHGAPVLISQHEQSEFLSNCTSLFEDPSLLKVFRFEDTESLLSQISTEIGLLLQLQSTPTKQAIDCIEATRGLFDKWYSTLDQYSTSCYMFWDAICNWYEDVHQLTERESEIKDRVVSAVDYLLNSARSNCQISALHGASHLRDPRLIPNVNRLARKSKDAAVSRYAQSVINNWDDIQPPAT